MSKPTRKTETLLAHLGRAPHTPYGTVNPAVYHASTILFDSLEAYESKDRPYRHGTPNYGRMGTPTSFALEDAVTELEGGHRCFLLCSGLAALNVAILSQVESGGHALICDAVYTPTRRFCDGLLTQFGVEGEYYDPLIGAGIAALFRPNSQVVHLESPGSLTFEMQDVPAIAAAAKSTHGDLSYISDRWNMV